MQLALNSQLFGRMRARGGPGPSDHNEIVCLFRVNLCENKHISD